VLWSALERWAECRDREREREREAKPRETRARIYCQSAGLVRAGVEIGRLKRRSRVLAACSVGRLCAALQCRLCVAPQCRLCVAAQRRLCAAELCRLCAVRAVRADELNLSAADERTRAANSRARKVGQRLAEVGRSEQKSRTEMLGAQVQAKWLQRAFSRPLAPALAISPRA